MNELQVFKNSEFGEIGILTINDKAYFPATECAKALGYSNPHKAIGDHCNGVTKREVIDKMGRTQTINLIPEGDLYRLIVRSKLPSAEKFERWVFDEVLPSIRRHGLYATEELLNDPDLFINALQQLKHERERNKILDLKNKQNEQLIGELKPKATYYDIILDNSGLVTITQIAKDYGMSGNAMNKLLHELGIQYKQSDQWLLYNKYHDKGYTHSKTVTITHRDGTDGVKMNTKWTQKGRLFLYDLLKNENVLPVIEQKQLA